MLANCCNDAIPIIESKDDLPAAPSHAAVVPRRKSAAKAGSVAKKSATAASSRSPKTAKRKTIRPLDDSVEEAPLVPIPVDSVPHDTWKQIFGWFVDRECRLLRRVCKQWSDLIGARALTQRTHEDDDRVSLHMPWSCHSIKRPFPWKDSPYASQVETLNMVCTDYGGSTESYFEETCPNLSNFRSLKNLAISSSLGALIELNEANLDRLETLTISAPHSLLPGVEKFAFGIQRLQLFGFTELITQDVKEMLTAFPSVRHLSFKGSSWQTPLSAISWLLESVGPQLESLSLSFERDSMKPEDSITLADVQPIVQLPRLRALALTLNPPHEPDPLTFGIIDDPFSDGSSVSRANSSSGILVSSSSTMAPSANANGSASSGASSRTVIHFASNTLESLSIKCLDGSRLPIRLEMPRLGSLVLDSMSHIHTSACPLLEQVKMWTWPAYASHFFDHAATGNLREISLLRSPAKLAARHLAIPLNLELPSATKLNLIDFSLQCLPSGISINGPVLKTLKMVFHLAEELGDQPDAHLPVTLNIPNALQVSVEANPHILSAIYAHCCKIPTLETMGLVKCRQWREAQNAEAMEVDAPEVTNGEEAHSFPRLTSLILGTSQPNFARLGHLARLHTLTIDADMTLRNLETILHNKNMPSLRICNVSARCGGKVAHRGLSVSLPSLQSLKISMSALPSVNFASEHPHLTDLVIIGPPSTTWWRRTARSIQKLDWLSSKVPCLQRLHLMQVKLATTLVLTAPKLVSLSMTGVTSHKNMKLTLKARRLRHLFIQDPGTPFEAINADLPALSLLRISRDVVKHKPELTRTVQDIPHLSVIVHGDNRKASYANLLRPFYGGAIPIEGDMDAEGSPDDPIDVDGDVEQQQKYQEVEARVSAANLPPEVKDYFGNNKTMAPMNMALPLLGRLFAQHNMLFNPIADLAMLGRAFRGGPNDGGGEDDEDDEEEEGGAYYCQNCHRMHYRARRIFNVDLHDDDDDDDDDENDLDEDEDGFLYDDDPLIHNPLWRQFGPYYSDDSHDEDEDEEEGGDGDLARFYGAYLGAGRHAGYHDDSDSDEE